MFEFCLHFTSVGNPEDVLIHIVPDIEMCNLHTHSLFLPLT